MVETWIEEGVSRCGAPLDSVSRCGASWIEVSVSRCGASLRDLRDGWEWIEDSGS